MRMEDAEGQGHSQEPREICPPIESANIQRCPNSEIFAINDKISVFVDVISVVSFENSNANAHPTTCQPNQLTIGQTQIPKNQSNDLHI